MLIMLVVEGPMGNGIGNRIASKSGFALVASRSKVFADGESEVGITGARALNGKEVAIVQSGYPDQDKRLNELYFLASQAKKNGAGSVIAVMPYLPYARQDKELKEKKVAVSLEITLHLMSASGINSLFTVAPHNRKALSAFSGNVGVTYATESLARLIRPDVKNPFVLAPDEGAIELAKSFSQIFRCNFAHVTKHRDRETGEIDVANAPLLNLENRDVVVLDDMISEGNSMALAVKIARRSGARRVVAAAVHLLLVKEARAKITEAGAEMIYGTNTVKSEGAKVADVSDEIAKGLNMIAFGSPKSFTI